MASVHEISDLFGHIPSLPEVFRYAGDIIDAAEDQALLQAFRNLPLKEFEFHGFTGKRRVVSFGWRYDFNGGGVQNTDDVPPFLLTVREKAAAFAKIAPSDLQQVLVTEYRPGAAIGWQKDRSAFGDVIGLSILSACIFRFRRKAGPKWERASLTIEPRSIYLLRGPSRHAWEHSIPAVEELWYSLTFRRVPGRCRARIGRGYAGVPQVGASACMLARVMPPVAIRSMALTIRAGSR